MISQILAHTLGSNWRVIAQGSYVQGLQVKESDLDLVLLDGTDRWKVMNRGRNADELETAVRRLCRAQWEGFPIRVNVIRKIYKARVPLVTMRVTLPAMDQQVEVDMCFGDSSRGLCDEFVHRLVSRVVQLEHFCLAIKVWANKRGLTETKSGGMSCFAFVLLAIFFHRQSGMHFSDFFDFVLSLPRSKPSLSVSVEAQQLVRRPSDGERDFLHVAVPCRPNENAARCLRPSVWNAKIVPELRRGSSLCKSIAQDQRIDIEVILSKLMAGSEVSSSRFDITESESSDDDLHHPIINLDEENHQSNEVLVSSKFGQQAQKIHPGPVSILECDSCNYFSFNKTDLLNHRFAVHKYSAPSPERPRKRYNNSSDPQRWKRRKFRHR
jgi:hypothetical protein